MTCIDDLQSRQSSAQPFTPHSFSSTPTSSLCWPLKADTVSMRQEGSVAVRSIPTADRRLSSQAAVKSRKWRQRPGDARMRVLQAGRWNVARGEPHLPLEAPSHNFLWESYAGHVPCADFALSFDAGTISKGKYCFGRCSRWPVQLHTASHLLS
jgi:hypothetical protein